MLTVKSDRFSTFGIAYEGEPEPEPQPAAISSKPTPEPQAEEPSTPEPEVKETVEKKAESKPAAKSAPAEKTPAKATGDTRMPKTGDVIAGIAMFCGVAGLAAAFVALAAGLVLLRRRRA